MKTVDDYLNAASDMITAASPLAPAALGVATPDPLASASAPSIIQLALLMATVDVLGYVSTPPILQVKPAPQLTVGGSKPIRNVGVA